MATVQQDLAPSSTFSRVNGKESLTINLTKTENGNSVSISQDVKNTIPDLLKKLGHNAKVTVVTDTAPYIRDSISALVEEGVLGAVFAILVIFLFLLSIRSTIVTAISIPLSVLIALIALWTQNYSLNVLTLSGLTIAVGRVVDDSIVVLENIYRHLRKGEPKQTATLLGVKEVAGAVTSSTLTTVAVFLPLAFIGGVVGEYTHPLALTVTLALLSSLVVALTVIPVFAYWFLKAPKSIARTEEKPTILERGYTPLISWVTKYRVITVVLAVLLLVGSFALFPLLPTNVLGNQLFNTLFFTLTLPTNTSLASTNQASLRVENVLHDLSSSGIQTYQATVGTNNASLLVSTSATNVASFMVTVAPGADANAIQQTLSERLKNLSVGTIVFLSQGSNSQDLTVQAPDDATLRQATNQVMGAITKHTNTSNVTSDLAVIVPLIDIRVNPAEAALHGLSAIQVAQLLQTIYAGTTSTQVVLDGTNNTRENVNLTMNASANTVQDMQNMQIPSPTGPVRLGDVADVTLTNEPGAVSHANGVRAATVTFTITSQNQQGVAQDVLQQVNNLKLPTGAQVSQGSNSASTQDTLNQLYLALLVAISLVFIIMAATFRSLLQPLILLVSIPFAATGSIVLAVITQTAIGVSSLFGFLMLIGIVVTNAIVLIDRVNQYRAQGMDPRSATIAGGRDRVRPILMTALATIMALVPTALGWASGSTSNLILSAGLAIVVIGGLTSSTLLTLLFVPTLYVMVETTKERLKKKAGVPVKAEEPELAHLILGETVSAGHAITGPFVAPDLITYDKAIEHGGALASDRELDTGSYRLVTSGQTNGIRKVELLRIERIG